MPSPARLDIPQDLMNSARISVADIKLEHALTLYAQRGLSIREAREFAGLSLFEFRQGPLCAAFPPHMARLI